MIRQRAHAAVEGSVSRLFDSLLSEGKGVRFAVSGSSMAPFIRSGDYVVVLPVARDSIALGDLIFFRQPGGRMALHRVLRVIRDRSGHIWRVLTKGDAVDTPDPPVLAADILARVVSVERILPAGVRYRRLDGRVTVAFSRIMGVYHLARSIVVRIWVARRHNCPIAQRQSRHILHAIHLGINRKTPPYPIDWPAAMNAAFAESLQGLLFKTAASLYAPRSVTSILENAYFTCLAQNTRRIEAIKAIEPDLRAKGVCAMVIKGAALIGSVYEDPGLRPMEDIDLMARPCEEQPLTEVLIKAGFARNSRFPGLFERDGIRFDLHVHPLNADRVAARAELLCFDSAALFARSFPFQPGMACVRRPSELDHVLILAQHMVKHSFAKLVWLEDIHRLLQQQDFHFLVRLNRTIRAYGQQRPMAYASYLTVKIMKTSLYPKQIPVSPPVVPFTRVEKALLDLRISGKSMGDWGNLLWLFCLPDKKDVIRFAAQTLFPVRAVLARENAGRSGHSGSALYRQRTAWIIKRILAGLPILAEAFEKSRQDGGAPMPERRLPAGRK